MLGEVHEVMDWRHWLLCPLPSSKALSSLLCTVEEEGVCKGEGRCVQGGGEVRARRRGGACKEEGRCV